MSLIKSRLATLLAALTLLSAAPATSAKPISTSGPQAVIAKACSAGYTHAVLPSGHKCLRRGQYCSRKRSFQRVYHAKGFHCRANRRLGYD